MDLKLKKFFKTQFLKNKGSFVDLPVLDGVKISSSSANLYNKKTRNDLCLFYFENGASHAAVFTKSKVVAECIKWNKQQKTKKVKGLFINTKNANALTGKQGFNSLKTIRKEVSKKLNIKERELYFASTGVIGEKFPITKIRKAIPKLVEKNKTSCARGWLQAAKSIMTTDTMPKLSKNSFFLKKKKINIAGIAKGSGMIFPNMGTMLGFIFTDLNISNQLLKIALKNNLDNTFNAITVDGDTSTNDMVCLFSTEKAKNKKIISAKAKEYKIFESKLNEVMLSLAKQITIDGEGASKFIEVYVIGAKSKNDAKQIAFSVANSQLFKTAIAGEDPNWGRILMAIGKSNSKTNIDKINLKLGDQFIFKNGNISKQYKEKKASKYMKGNEIKILINLNLGKSEFKAYSCDLTHKYISINADYRN
tara:strand:+ start:182 stop:1444 length:1263 start_codon:yes stop_codon:yes gene_type:complete